MTDIEIVFDPRANALGSGISLNENHEIMPDSEWILWARRFSGIKDLFQYRHKETGNFVLAKWLYHPDTDGVAIAMELEAFEQPLDWFPPTQEWVRSRLRSSEAVSESIKRGIRDRAHREAFAKRQQIEEKHKVADWLKRNGKEDAASSLRQRKWSGEATPEFESFTEDLRNRAKGRVVTSGI